MVLGVGREKEFDAREYFRDPENQALAFTVRSDRPSVVAVSVDEGTVTLKGVLVGAARVTVTASDPDRASISQRFEVNVKAVPALVPREGPIVLNLIGDSAVLELNELFRHDEPMTFAATSGNPRLVSAEVRGSSLFLVSGLDGIEGATTVEVTAEVSGIAATAGLTVLVQYRAKRRTGTGWRLGIYETERS